MIKYTIENKGGIHHVSNFFDINENLGLIRIVNKSLILKEEYSSPILIITNFSINGIEVSYKKHLSPHWNHSTFFDLITHKFLKDTNDIKIELKENSKIEVSLFTGDINNPLVNYTAPTIYK